MAILKSVSIQGYKTIRDAQIELTRLNVLIGANGAGKSNFVSFFGLLGQLARGAIQSEVARAGGACSMLYYGPEVTGETKASLLLETAAGDLAYSFALSHAPKDCLVFTKESVGPPGAERNLGGGQHEARVSWPDQTAMPGEALEALARLCVYRFHETPSSARVKAACDVNDKQALSADGLNLAAVLLRIRNEHPDYYGRITATLRQCVPVFGDFELVPVVGEERLIRLEWRENGSQRVFGAHELSDGTLRLVALITLLLQPPEMLPPILVIDEPELGLHPFGVNILAALLRQASASAQLIIATQSVTLLNHFEPGEVLVTEREPVNAHFESVFHRVTAEELAEWLPDYSLGELWEKNVIGGRP